MNQPESPREADFDQESAKLSEGLKTCRWVLESYRTMLETHRSNDEEGASGLAGINDNIH